MILKEDELKLKDIARKYNLTKLYLFGSGADSKKESGDIDIAVDGLDDSLFFKFYGELIFSLSKPVDVVDLKNKSLFCDMIKEEGVLLYG